MRLLWSTVSVPFVVRDGYIRRDVFASHDAQAMQKARQERDRNLLVACAAACLSLLLSLLEYVTRFATVRAAITGEAFFAAGRNVVALLSRNAMDAFGVWWVPGVWWGGV